jgi:hypothetical protein
MYKLKTRLIPTSERFASPGKFRLVILIDGDFYQIEDDFDEFESAFRFGKENVEKGKFIAIYDDKGICLDPKLYEAGYYKVWSAEEIELNADAVIRTLKERQVAEIRSGHHVFARTLGIVIQLAETQLLSLRNK